MVGTSADTVSIIHAKALASRKPELGASSVLAAAQCEFARKTVSAAFHATEAATTTWWRGWVEAAPIVLHFEHETWVFIPSTVSAEIDQNA